MKPLALSLFKKWGWYRNCARIPCFRLMTFCRRNFECTTYTLFPINHLQKRTDQESVFHSIKPEYSFVLIERGYRWHKCTIFSLFFRCFVLQEPPSFYLSFKSRDYSPINEFVSAILRTKREEDYRHVSV